MNRVGIIGGGAAGLMAAYAAAENGAEVTLHEKNEKLGKKIYITGKGRCNLTNDCDEREFFANVVSNPKFLMSSVHRLPPSELMALFTSNGLKLKTERGNRVFPASDKASDVTKCLESMLRSRGVKILLESEISSLITENGRAIGLKSVDRNLFYDKIIICTGGISYPSTGSTGDGYRFAREAGHSLTEPCAALTGIDLEGDFGSLAGLTLKNVSVSVFDKDRRVFSDFGELLFTHTGVSGPVVLTASSFINRMHVKGMTFSVDLKPALSPETLDARILSDFRANINKNFANSLGGLLPKSLIPTVIERSGIEPYKKLNAITHAERQKLLSVLKKLDFAITSLRPVEEGIVTAGGVNVKEINPATMESRIVKGLYFAGEVIDVDALTGGFNLQTAFSTGYAAGVAAASAE